MVHITVISWLQQLRIFPFLVIRRHPHPRNNSSPQLDQSDLRIDLINLSLIYLITLSSLNGIIELHLISNKSIILKFEATRSGFPDHDLVKELPIEPLWWTTPKQRGRQRLEVEHCYGDGILRMVLQQRINWIVYHHSSHHCRQNHQYLDIESHWEPVVHPWAFIIGIIH